MGSQNADFEAKDQEKATIRSAAAPSAELPSAVTGSLAERIWKIRWDEIFPLAMSQSGSFIDRISFERAGAFAAAHYAELFETEADDTRFLWQESNAAKARYYRDCADCFGFFADNELVGIIIGTATDWSTYYIRTSGILKAYQGHFFVQKFLDALFEHLPRYEVARLEAETSPSNIFTAQLFARLRFNMTGMVLSERWGTNLRFTKFLSEKHEEIFLKQFCSGVRPQLKEQQGRPRKGKI